VSRPISRDPEKDPAYALGRTLRRLREAAGFSTPAAAGARLGYGPDSIRKAESGAQVPVEPAILKMLDVYQVPDLMRPTVLDMWKLARKSKGPIPEFFEKYAAAEEQAAFLRLWGLLLMPGPLQTREYAHAMFLASLSEDEATEHADQRMKRRAKVEGPDAAHVTALIYELTLNGLVGSPQVMVGQLEDLLGLSERRNVIIQVVPDTGYFPGRRGGFEIASGPAITDTVAMVTVQDSVAEDPDTARTVIELFEEIRSTALNVADSREAITEAIGRWKTRQ
jgi:transcriptional regulator with XRE-family HTH domain